MKQTYTFNEITLKDNGSIHNTIKRTVDFYPATNEINYIDTDIEGWELTPNTQVGQDSKNKILPNVSKTTVVGFTSKQPIPPEYVSIKRTIEGLVPDTDYFLSVYVRNNAVSSTQLLVGGELADYSIIHYVQRLGAVFTTDSNGEVEIEIKSYDPKGKPSGYPVPLIWVDGFYATKLSEDLQEASLEEIKEAYPYVIDERVFPTQYDILKPHKTQYSPYRYSIVFNGRRITEYHKGVHHYGMVEGSEYVVHEMDKAVAIMNAFYNDVPLMSMLEQEKTHVSHAFPKEDAEMSMLGESHFPRIQYFTGFSVNRKIVDGKPFASEVNYAVNVYIPTFKVMESVSAVMITEQIKAIMAELGWATVRGSDYFLKKEQLYVLQTQFIQDAKIVKR